jgi:uncharacterized protein YciI
MVDRNATLEWFLANRHAELALYVMILEPTETCPPPGTDEFFAVLREHFVYWWELEEAGVLVGAGPLEWDAPGTGMALVRAASRDEAERLAAGEPFAMRGFRRNVVHPWQLNEGTLVEVVRSM